MATPQPQHNDDTRECPYCQGEGEILVRTAIDDDAPASCPACYGDGFFEACERIPESLPPIYDPWRDY